MLALWLFLSGHYMLDADIYEKNSYPASGNAKRGGEMIIDHWNPSEKEYRTEAFC